MFITGVRKSESQRRMGHVKEVTRDGNTVWVAPILNFDHQALLSYRHKHELPTNEVTQILHMSGECLCGAFAKPNELEYIGMFYPTVAKRIKNLEAAAQSKGLRSCKWGTLDSSKLRKAPGPLCPGCAFDPKEPEAGMIITVTKPIPVGAST
ncbi:MAG: hypothetical protein FJ319_08755 [SAR202 cluster bacterium]|nr:hypothetical protein [SAR202 cluster bacterium]